MFYFPLECNCDSFETSVRVLTDSTSFGASRRWEYLRSCVIEHEKGGKFGSEGFVCKDWEYVETIADPVRGRLSTDFFDGFLRHFVSVESR
jgi:hypothetical protein